MNCVAGDSEVVQLVEHWQLKPGVLGSISSLNTSFTQLENFQTRMIKHPISKISLSLYHTFELCYLSVTHKESEINVFSVA